MGDIVTRDQVMAQARGESASQATSIEKSRAVAEVQGALVVAQQRPRDETKALTKAVESCRTLEVAESAFFKFPRSGQTVSGETIHLAVELARCWGNIAYGIMELDRDDNGAKSEMLAFAWDLETNAQSRMTFIVPHKRDKRGGPETLTDMRDIYENNANMGARRLRECIYRVLPPYLKEAAKAQCYKTLEGGQGDKPLTVSITEAIDAFKAIGISRDRIEAKVGPVGNLTPADLANLKVSYRSITRNEVSADEEFPRVGVEDVTAAARKVADGAKAKPADKEPEKKAEAESSTSTDEHPARRKADDIIRSAKTCANIIDLTNIRSGQKDNIDAMPDEMAAEVRAALDAAEKRLKGGGE